MQVRQGAAAVVVRSGAVLLVQRRNPPDRGLWSYPGGHVEAGETVEAAALRELCEETGLRARAEAVVTVLELGGVDGPRFQLAMVRCRWLSGTPRAADDAAAAEWVALAEVLTRARPMSRDVDRVLRMALDT